MCEFHVFHFKMGPPLSPKNWKGKLKKMKGEIAKIEREKVQKSNSPKFFQSQAKHFLRTFAFFSFGALWDSPYLPF